MEFKGRHTERQDRGAGVTIDKVAAAVGLLVGFSTLFAACGLVTGIFKAGLVIGILLVIIVIAVIWWIASKFRK